MTKLVANQLSLIAELDLDVEDLRVGDWGWDDVGTKEILVPMPPLSKIGTEKILVPTPSVPKIGTEIWQPPIGCLEQKLSQDRKYWYWRYYDNLGKKRSLYLAKDYNKAVNKAMKIGTPIDAKLPKLPAPDPQATNSKPTAANLIDLAQTAYGASRNPRAA